MAERIEIITGEGLDRYGAPITDVLGKEHDAYKLVAEAFGGYSANHLDGGWISNAQLIQEPALDITALVEDSDLGKVQGVAEAVRALFNQQSVIVAKSPLDALQYVNAESKHEVASTV